MVIHGNDKYGFTLIELLVVVLIIGILAGIALPQYQKAVEESRASEIVSNVNVLSKTAEMYFLSGSTETIGVEDLEVELGGCVYGDGNCYTKHAIYYFNCHGGASCGIETYRRDGCPDGTGNCDWTHHWSIYRRWENGQMMTNKCITQLTKTGRYICEELEGEGYTYADEEL